MKPRFTKVVFSIPFHAQGYLTKMQNRRFAASKITEMLKKKKKKKSTFQRSVFLHNIVWLQFSEGFQGRYILYSFRLTKRGDSYHTITEIKVKGVA